MLRWWLFSRLERGKGTRHENIWGTALLVEGTASSGGWITPGVFTQRPGWRLEWRGQRGDWEEMRLIREWGCCVVLGIGALSRPDSQPEGLERKWQVLMCSKGALWWLCSKSWVKRYDREKRRLVLIHSREDACQFISRSLDPSDGWAWLFSWFYDSTGCPLPCSTFSLSLG